jgi:hypothetical protein
MLTLKLYRRKNIFKRVIRIFTLLPLFFLSFGTINAAKPVWIGSPNVTNIKPKEANLNFQINEPSNVYIVVYTTLNPFTSGFVKIYSSWSEEIYRPVTDQLVYTSGDVGSIMTDLMDNLKPNTNYWAYIVAQDIATGTIQDSPVVIPFKTLACPAISMGFNWSTPNECVNKGSTLKVTFYPGDTNPEIDGLYTGTPITIYWGDGNTTSWTLTAAEHASASFFRTHTYTLTTTCNYEPYVSITSLCDPLIIKENKTSVVIHGLDTQGEGELSIVDNSTGLSIIEVCEGKAHTIELKDMSTWNCQTPTWLDGSPAPANLAPRTIQWVYGMDNSGVLQNTIGQTLGVTDPVVIGGLNPTVRGINGFEQPVITPAVYQGEQSMTIEIPASCRKDEYYDVYLRNWNKCNAYGVDPPVFTPPIIWVT